MGRFKDIFKRGSKCATKQDLKETEERILRAFGERVDPSVVKTLKKESAALEKAVEQNKTSS